MDSTRTSTTIVSGQPSIQIQKSSYTSDWVNDPGAFNVTVASNKPMIKTTTMVLTPTNNEPLEPPTKTVVSSIIPASLSISFEDSKIPNSTFLDFQPSVSSENVTTTMSRTTVGNSAKDPPISISDEEVQPLSINDEEDPLLSVSEDIPIRVISNNEPEPIRPSNLNMHSENDDPIIREDPPIQNKSDQRPIIPFNIIIPFENNNESHISASGPIIPAPTCSDNCNCHECQSFLILPIFCAHSITTQIIYPCQQIMKARTMCPLNISNVALPNQRSQPNNEQLQQNNEKSQPNNKQSQLNLEMEIKHDAQLLQDPSKEKQVLPKKIPSNDKSETSRKSNEQIEVHHDQKDPVSGHTIIKNTKPATSSHSSSQNNHNEVKMELKHDGRRKLTKRGRNTVSFVIGGNKNKKSHPLEGSGRLFFSHQQN